MQFENCKISPQLSTYIIKNGQIDLKELEKIVSGTSVQDARLIEEARILLESGLNGNKLWGNVGETFEKTPNNDDDEKLKVKFHQIFGVESYKDIFDYQKFTLDGWKDVFPETEYTYLINEDGIIIKPLDPDNKCDFEIEKGEITILTYHDYSAGYEYYYQLIANSETGDIIKYAEYGEECADEYTFSKDLNYNVYEHTNEFDDTEIKEYIGNEEIYSNINGNVKDKIANLLSDEFENKNFWKKFNSNKITKTIYDNVNCLNVQHLFTDYTNQTCRSLLQDLQKNNLNDAYDSIITDVIINSMLIEYQNDIVEWLGGEILAGLADNDKERLNCAFEVIECISDLSLAGLLMKFADDNLSDMQEIADSMGENYYVPMSDEYIEEKVKPASGLIGMINNSNLPEKNKGIYISAILSKLSKEAFCIDKNIAVDILSADLTPIINDKNRYVEDILTDMKEHKTGIQPYYKSLLNAELSENKLFEEYNKNTDLKKYIIDLKRLGLRQRFSRFSSTSIQPPNCKFDRVIKQTTSDCWLLAGLISFINRDAKVDDSDKILSDIIKTDENGDYIVNFKGVNKQYVISKEDEKLHKYLVNSERDARILELAVDKYIKETAYEIGSTEDVDINGNWTALLFKLIVGNGERDFYNNEEYNFNDNNKVFVFSCSSVINPQKLLNAGEYVSGFHKNVNLDTRHAYSIIGSDEKYIYAITPWDSSRKIRIEIEKFKELNPLIDYAVVR